MYREIIKRLMNQSKDARLQPLKILFITTKPPWPPHDGGRWATLTTLEALAGAGHSITMVSPIDPNADNKNEIIEKLRRFCTPVLVKAISLPVHLAAAKSLMSGLPLSIVRHSLAPVQAEVERLCVTHKFDVVHAEQIQALPQSAIASRIGVPTVLRALNVESVLWRFSGRVRKGLFRWLFSVEEKRMARWEVAALRSADAVVVVTSLDENLIRKIVANESKLVRIFVPFPDDLNPGEQKLKGDPVVSIITSTDWLPAWDAIRQFVHSRWPVVLESLPEAHLHVFGCARPVPAAPGVSWHQKTPDSSQAFPDGAIFLVPSRHPTGVPIKALEAWSRGLPLVVSSDAAEALEARHGREVLVADDDPSLVRAMTDLSRDQTLRSSVVEQGRRRLRNDHSFSKVAGQLSDVYRSVASARAKSSVNTPKLETTSDVGGV